jgi:hypothetical protein
MKLRLPSNVLCSHDGWRALYEPLQIVDIAHMSKRQVQVRHAVA